MPSRATYLSFVLALLLSGASGLLVAAEPGETLKPELLLQRDQNRFVGVQSVRFQGRVEETLIFRRGRAMWRTDGSAEGTCQVCGPEPGFCPAAGLSLPSPRSYLLLDDAVIVPGLDIFRGQGVLRRTDGTGAGTFPLTDPSHTRLDDGFPRNHFHVHEPTGRVFFQAEDLDAGSGQELWITDGTVEGTRELVDLVLGDFSSAPLFGATVGSRVVFAAEDPDAGREPWVTDGTSDGTFRLADLNPGPEGSNPLRFSTLGDRVLFLAFEEDGTTALYRTEGTPAGTQRIEKLAGDSGFFLDAGLRESRLLVTRHPDERRLWVTDGTSAGTRVLRVFEPSAGPNGLAVTVGSRVLFIGRGLWATDGTPDGTREVLSRCLEICNPFVQRLTSLGDRAVFSHDDGIHGRELWVTDGTPEGTRLLADLCPGLCSSEPEPIDRRDEFVRVLADAGDGEELWRVRLSTGEAVRFTDFTASRPFSGSPVSFDGEVIFSGTDLIHGQALWRSDGTTEGTSPFATLVEPSPGNLIRGDFVRLGREVFFMNSLPENELWATRGTAAETRLVWRAPDGVSRLVSLRRFGTSLLFFAATSGQTVDLYRSDGTAEGTVLIADDLEGSLASRIEIAEDRAFLLNIESGSVWVTDGTAEHTQSLGGLGSIGGSQALGDRLFFWSRTAGRATLWVSDGSAAGTRIVSERAEAIGDSPLVVAGDVLYFVARHIIDPNGSREVVWRSDGTPEGTRLIESAEGSLEGRNLVAAGSRVFFFGRGADADGAEGLWVITGPGNAVARRLSNHRGFSSAALDDMLFFLSSDPAGNLSERIWRSDGTPEGTHPIDPPLRPSEGLYIDFRSGAGYLWMTIEAGAQAHLWAIDPTGDLVLPIGQLVFAKNFLRLGKRVVFFAANDDNGFEAWGIDLPPRPGDPSESPPLAPRKLGPTSP